MKTCCKCKNERDFEYFVKNSSSKDGRSGRCKLCDAIYREKNKERSSVLSKQYRLNNKEKSSEYHKDYAKTHKDCIKKYQKEYAQKNKEKIKDYQKKYRDENRDTINGQIKEYSIKNKNKIKEYKTQYYLKNKARTKEKQREYYLKNKENIANKSKIYRAINQGKIRSRRKNYLESNPDAKLSKALRCRIRMALKVRNCKKSDSTYNLLGCSKKFFQDYIVSKFTKGMTLENNSVDGWHLDHIVPCASFDLSDPDQQKLCFHYTNYQPLWATKEIAMRHGENSNYIGNLEKGSHMSLQQ